MKTKKGLPAKAGIIHLLPLILVAGVVVAAIGGLFYFNQGSDQPLIVKTETEEELGTSEFETSDLDTSDWKTYRNEELGISFKHPKQLQVIEANDNGKIYSLQESAFYDKNEYLNSEKLDSLMIYIYIVDDRYFMAKINENKEMKKISLNGVEGYQGMDYFKNTPVLTTFINNQSFKIVASLIPSNSEKEDLYNQILSTFEFIDNVDNDIFTMELPDGYRKISSVDGVHKYGFNDFPYLTIDENIFLYDVNELSKCIGEATETCIAKANSFSWAQSEDIAEIVIDGKVAKSFYVAGGVDNVYHVLQIEDPKIEIRMYVAGGGLDQQFKKIMDSFEFIE